MVVFFSVNSSLESTPASHSSPSLRSCSYGSSPAAGKGEAGAAAAREESAIPVQHVVANLRSPLLRQHLRDLGLVAGGQDDELAVDQALLGLDRGHPTVGKSSRRLRSMPSS